MRIPNIRVMVKQFAREYPKQIVSAMHEMLAAAGDWAATQHMVPASGRLGIGPYATNVTRLTWKTGRFARALMGADPASIRTVRLESGQIIGEFGMKTGARNTVDQVAYPFVHEMGRTFIPTPQQTRFFYWAYLQTKHPMWKALYIKGRWHLSVTIPRRPVLWPTIHDARLHEGFMRILETHMATAMSKSVPGA